MKKCPFCAEDIQDAAVVCKHCGRDLTGKATTQVQMPPVVKVRQADWISTTAKWGVGLFFVMIGIGWCSSLMRPAPPARALSATERATPPAANAPKPQAAQSSPTIPAEDMKREKKGRFRSRDVSAVEKDGQWVVLFTPALPRSDEAVLGAAEYALREFLGANTNNAKWRPVDKFLRCITGSGIFDVLIIKNDDGTVYGMSIVKR